MHLRRSSPFLAFAVALVLPYPAASAISFGVGPKLGINLGNASSDDVDETSMRMGVAAGAVAEFGVTTPFSLVIEPAYIQRGADFEAGNLDGKGELNYFEIPILAKAKFGKIASHAYVFAGPSIGFNLGIDGSWGPFAGDFEDQAAPITWSGEVGLGGAMAVRKFVYLSADVRYTHGFNNALEEAIGGIEEWAARDIRLSLGVLFHLTE